MYIYVIDGSNRLEIGLMIGFYDRVFIFLPRSKPDRGTGQKTDNPRPDAQILMSNPRPVGHQGYWDFGLGCTLSDLICYGTKPYKLLWLGPEQLGSKFAIGHVFLVFYFCTDG